MRRTAVLLLAVLGATAAHAQTPVRHVPGYRCMMLNITEQQSMAPNFRVTLRSAPSPTAAEAGWAPAVVIVREPLTPQNGFLQVLRPDGTAAWIPSNMVKPYRPAAAPEAKCFPTILSNGRVGTTSH